MPRAVADSSNTERFSLETAPPDGFVRLRRQTFGERKRRDDLVTSMTIEAADRSKQNGSRLSSPESMSIAINNLTVAHFDLKTCVVEHNLEDELGHLLDFGNPKDIERLDVRVGEEIEKYIRRMNSPDDEEGDQFQRSDRKIHVLQQEIGGSESPHE
jgi:hypothetical protein